MASRSRCRGRILGPKNGFVLTAFMIAPRGSSGGEAIGQHPLERLQDLSLAVLRQIVPTQRWVRRRERQARGDGGARRVRDMVRILRIVCPAAAHSTALTPTARRGQRLLVTLYPSQLQPLREGDSVGTSFVFKNRRGDRLKILAWQGDGFALYLRKQV